MTAVGYGYTTNRVFGKADNTGYRCGLLLVHSLPLEIPVGVYVETWNNLGKLFTDLGWNRKNPATTNSQTDKPRASTGIFSQLCTY